MLCERCQQREATIHLTQVVDGEVKKVHLCQKCAEEAGFDLQGSVSVSDILLGMGVGKAQESTPEKVTRCPRCGMGLSDFKQRERLGCPACYDAFADELMPLIKAMHRSERHVGKRPGEAGGLPMGVRRELEQLRGALESAVAEENYEEAARLRDRIRSLESSESAEGDGERGQP